MTCMRLKFSITLKLLVLILPLVCLPIAIVGYFSFQASVDRVNRLVRDEQMAKVKSTAEGMNAIFDYCRLDLATIASLPVLEDYFNARTFRLEAEAEFNRDNIIRLFTDFITRTTYYDQIRYLDRDGHELIKVNRQNNAAFLPEKGSSEKKQNVVFQNARQTEQTGIRVSTIMPSGSNGRRVIHWTQSIFSGLHEFAGVVIIDLNYEKIIRMVKDIHIGERGYAFLVDDRGSVIAHPRFKPFELHLDNFPDPSIKELVLEMMTGASGWKPYYFENQEKVAAFAPIPSMKWSLAATITTDEYRKEAVAIRSRVIKAVVITLAFAVAAVTLLTYFLLKPVRYLVRATDRIAGGDPGHEIPIQSRDELGDLTRSFNRMVKNLAQVREELVRSEKLVSLGRLSAGVAHEIRNPLNAMKGAIVHLQRRRSDDRLVKEYTHLVSEEIDRLNQFVSEFLHFAGQSRPKPVSTDINQLIISTQQLFEEQAKEKEIRFHNRLDNDLPIIVVDPYQIEQVVVNILINAMDAITDGGDITFSSRTLNRQNESKNKRTIQVTIDDNGIGIPPDQLKNVFDPFFSTKDTGTGLGLPLSLGIVENHGGHIHISSQEGIGTSVIIDLPIQYQFSKTTDGQTHENHTGR